MSSSAPGGLRVRFHERREQAEQQLAREIAGLVRDRGRVVLGLATGATPTGVYRALAALRAEGSDFSRVVAFLLDEYLGLEGGDRRTFANWAGETVLDPLGIPPENRRALDLGSRHGSIEETCLAYERAIRDEGGIDLQVLGVGRNGHVAFNEPGSRPDSRTREVELHPVTREDAAGTFGSLGSVPERAVTMGIATILEARRLRLLAFGSRKAEIVRRVLEGPAGPDVPATLLRGHPDASIALDREASALLSARRPTDA